MDEFEKIAEKTNSLEGELARNIQLVNTTYKTGYDAGYAQAKEDIRYNEEKDLFDSMKTV